MKKYNRFVRLRHCVLGTLLALSMLFCHDFLTMKPRGEKIVRTAEDYRDVMASFMRMMSVPNASQLVPLFGLDYFAMPYFNVSQILAIYSGEMTLDDGLYSRYYDTKSAGYNAHGHSYLSWSASDARIWDQYYSLLGPLNLILSDIDKKEITDKTVRNMVVGEALVWRAYAHFKLLQYYAPYDNNELGIPMYPDPTNDIGNAMPERATQAKVYRQIEEDLTTALGLLDQTPTQPWNFAYRRDFIHAFLAGVYWYKADGGAKESSDWAKALEHSGIAMRDRNLETSEAALRQIFDNSQEGILSKVVSDEFFLRIVDGDNAQKMNFVESYYSGITNGQVSPEYYQLYTPDDRRAFFVSEDHRVNKYNHLKTLSTRRGFGVYMPFRLAELYLISAEANIHLGNVSQAAEVLDTFKASRYIRVADFPRDAQGLLKEIQAERKKEFFAEIDARWIAMKRYREERRREVDGKEYKLSGNDFRYTFPIPEMSVNTAMVQNPGW